MRQQPLMDLDPNPKRWTNNARAIALLTVGCLVLVGAVTAILYARQDRGFIVDACVQPDAPVKPALHKPGRHPIKWWVTDYPVDIWIMPDAEVVGGTFVEAVQAWDEDVGKSFFEPPQPGSPLHQIPDPAIIVTCTNSDGTEYEDGEIPARLLWDAMCRLRRVEIRFPCRAPQDRWLAIARHELGHALGLDHDDHETSVMYRKALAPGPLPGTGWPEGIVSPNDRDLLLGN
jgi:hypothetical protein